MSGIQLQVKNLTCGYDAFQLKNIDLRITDGEILGIIGPNGSGKTTLIRAITKLIKPESGDILLSGQSIHNLGYNQLARRMAVVSQQPANSYLKVREYVLLGRTPHYRKLQFFENKKDFRMMEHSLELTGLTQYADQSLAEMSGGEQQLAAIARALCQQPELLILDEPTAFLDITHQVAIMDLLKRLNKEEGMGVIMVLHDLNLASEYCHRLLLLNQGRMHKLGTPQEVLTYNTIEEVYKTVVVVKNNPISNRPYIFPISQEYIRK